MSLDERELVGPMLSDGTLLTDLIDTDRRHVSLRLFSDPEVHRLELQYLFARTWNIVGHETEIPEPGDYVSRSIGQDAVIVTRDREGEISVILNVCPHRGMQVCRSEIGNQATFRCPYHGWTFDSRGSLVGTPFQVDMYGNDFDKTNLGLRRARVSTYAGIIFANWDETAPPLEDFLGEYSFYLDTIFNRTTDGLECIGAPQRFVINANWKAASEQFNGADGYHAATLHRSLIEAVVRGGATESAMKSSAGAKQVLEATRQIMFGVDIGSPQGHGVRCMAVPPAGDGETPLTSLEVLRQHVPIHLPPELIDELPLNLTEGQLHTMATFAPYPGGIFPNVGFLGMNIRTHMPIGPGKFEMRNWVFVEKKSSPEFKAAVRRDMLAGFGTSGTIEQDDAEAWPAIQRSSEGYIGSQSSMKYQAFIGHNPPEGWEGGAYVYEGFSKDDSAWHFWLRYREYMSGKPW